MIDDKLMNDLGDNFRQLLSGLSAKVEEMKKGLSPKELEEFKRHEKRVTQNAKNGVMSPMK